MFFHSILGSRIYQRKSSLDGGEEELIKLLCNHNQQNGENAENHEVEMLTLPMKKNKNITYQGMDANSNYFYEKN